MSEINNRMLFFYNRNLKKTFYFCDMKSGYEKTGDQ